MRLVALLFFVVILGSSSNVFAQGSKITEHGNVSAVMLKYKEQNNESVYVKGWRIQIVTTDDRRRMEREKAKFERLYPDINTAWEHKAPFYVVKVGAFRDKRDFQGFLLEVKKDFSSAIPIIERIKKEELVR